MAKIKNQKLSANISDKVTNFIGSWGFITTQSIIIIFWIFFNATGVWLVWDPYPFIFLNLALSFQAAYTAPIIMMSQNRQNKLDRDKAEADYTTNIKAELEIEQNLTQIKILENKILEIEKKIDNEIKVEKLIPQLMSKLNSIEQKMNVKSSDKI
jgi:uncharacterized membrane protein